VRKPRLIVMAVMVRVPVLEGADHTRNCITVPGKRQAASYRSRHRQGRRSQEEPWGSAALPAEAGWNG
jgi:hypothetical protein